MIIYSLVVLLLVASTASCINNRPIIGVFTQPSSNSVSKFGEQFVAASYVKFLESAGARVAPIKYTISAQEAQELFSSINGLLLPGGGVDFGTQHQYWNTLSLFYKLAVQANQQGDYFPVWGTCMGFQELCLLQSQDMDLLTSYDSENLTLPLDFTALAATSRLFGNASKDIVNTLGTQPVTMNNHQYGVSPSDWNANKYLTSFFNVLSTNVDRAGKEFISTIEGKTVPIYAAQWHAEKVGFEWNIHEVINHSTESVLANQYVANFFVAECRKSTHTFTNISKETAALIYNYQPVYTYPEVNDFEQGYFFNA
jgi:gamma-glutamyl hydrolase